MKDHDFTAVQMFWKPSLIELTQVGHADCDDGADTACFIDPQLISSISRQGVKMGFTTDTQRELGSVTAVAISASQVLYVKESPGEVARLRDKALGHEQKTSPPVTPLRDVSCTGTSTGSERE